jgi:hypothetical protein
MGATCYLLARAMSVAPIKSLDFSRSNARGRSDQHSPKDAWTSKRMTSPGILQDRRRMNSASSPFRLNDVSSLAATDRSGFRQQISVGWPCDVCMISQDPRDESLFRGQRAWQAPRFLQESEDGIRRRRRRQTARIFRHMAAGPSSLHSRERGALRRNVQSGQGARLGGSQHCLGQEHCLTPTRNDQQEYGQVQQSGQNSVPHVMDFLHGYCDEADGRVDPFAHVADSSSDDDEAPPAKEPVRLSSGCTAAMSRRGCTGCA